MLTRPVEVLTHALSHLSPADLASVALVSRRFHSLVTSPHAWRGAFARYFPGPESLTVSLDSQPVEEDDEALRSEKRAFARLTALPSWRSEYIVRTRLLRSLARGKPMQAMASPSTARSGQSHIANTTTMYNSQLFTTVNHLHATFGTGLNKRFPRFIHGADDVGTASTSDPSAGKIDSWGLSDPQFFLQFFERSPGDAQWGLGPGEIVGVPNVMDVSQPYGMVHGEGSPGGLVYHRSVEEMRGRFLAPSLELSIPDLGIPRIAATREAMCAVWIAKSSAIPSLSEGLVGILSGSSAGVVTAYSLGSDNFRDSRLARGELTARWVLSPGVPIIAIAVDDNYSIKRQAQNRIWAVALNALGELFYLTKFPKRASVERGAKLNEETQEQHAWSTGRSIYWNVVEPSRRMARPNPYNDHDIDGSYSPRSSWNGMCLAKDQIKAESREIEAFLQKKPKDFRKACLGWDMRRKLLVDFAGDDGNLGGESIVVFDCGLDEGTVAAVKRYTRCRFEQEKIPESANGRAASSNEDFTPTIERSSLFGGASTPDTLLTVESQPPVVSRARRSSLLSNNASPERTSFDEEWRCSLLSFDGLKSNQLSSTAIDSSTYAVITLSEDPALGFAGASQASSPYATPMSTDGQPGSASDVPGQRARFVAAGTMSGNVFIWNVRAPASRTAELTNIVDPVRIIYTDSPQISCLALTALQLVHGGNDGLVQAWDILASSMQPIRTLHSRFRLRARRRLVQAQASPQGVGINLFAAGAICLDPDPTVLRGMVSLGTHLRYWSYSSSAADQYKSSKRRLRRSERGSNSGGERLTGVGRTSNLKHYIANEKLELDRDEELRQREADRLAGRFGVDLLSSEEEALAYAALLSEESLAQDLQRRGSQDPALVKFLAPAEGSSAWSQNHVTPGSSVAGRSCSPPAVKSEDELDADIAAAIRLSLEGDSVVSEIPVRYSKAHKSPPIPNKSSPVVVSGESSTAKELADLEFALQLSMAEEQSRREAEGVGDEFHALGPADGVKGKGRA